MPAIFKEYGYIDYEIMPDYVKILYIESDRGFGAKLLNLLKRRTKKDILAEVSSNNVIAIEFFKKQGFRIVEEEDNILYLLLVRRKK